MTNYRSCRFLGDGDFSWTYESVDEERRAAVQVTFVTALYLGDHLTMCAALSAGADVNLDLSVVWRLSPTLPRGFTPIKAATALDDGLIWDALVENGAVLGGVPAPAGPHLYSWGNAAVVISLADAGVGEVAGNLREAYR